MLHLPSDILSAKVFRQVGVLWIGGQRAAYNILNNAERSMVPPNTSGWDYSRRRPHAQSRVYREDDLSFDSETDIPATPYDVSFVPGLAFNLFCFMPS